MSYSPDPSVRDHYSYPKICLVSFANSESRWRKALLRLGREARAAPYTMLEIIDTSHNYSMDYLDTYNTADVLDENGALKSTKSKEFSTIDNLGLELVSQEL